MPPDDRSGVRHDVPDTSATDVLPPAHEPGDRVTTSAGWHDVGMDAPTEPGEVRFVGVSLDCADPAELAEFYLRLLGGRVLWSRPSSVGVQVPGGLLIPQRVESYRPPQWPGSSIVHLDLTAGDRLDEPVQRAVALGARLADPQPDPRWRVLLDPAGHPFCITTVAPSAELLET
jgi:hypothetical protein